MTIGLRGDEKLDEDFISFVASALKRDSKERPSAKELLAHPFMKEEEPQIQDQEPNWDFLTDGDEASALSFQLQDEEYIWGFHMNSENIIAGSSKGSIHVIDANRLKKRRMTETEKCHTTGSCITSCGSVFAVSGQEGKISMWKTHSEQNKCELIKVLDCHGGSRILCIKISKNFLVSKGDDKNIVIHQRSQSSKVKSQIATIRLGATNEATNNIGQNQEYLVQCGVMKLFQFSRHHSMVLSANDQLYFTDSYHLKHYSLSRSGEPQLVTQMKFKDELYCLTASSKNMLACKGYISHPRSFWVGTCFPAKIMKVDLLRKAVLAEVEVWKNGWVKQIQTFGKFLLCLLQEPKTNYMSCICFALSDLLPSGDTSLQVHVQHSVPFQQIVLFGSITSDVSCKEDMHVSHFDDGEFHQLSVKQLEDLPKQTSPTLHPDFEQ